EDRRREAHRDSPPPPPCRFARALSCTATVCGERRPQPTSVAASDAIRDSEPMPRFFPPVAAFVLLTSIVATSLDTPVGAQTKTTTSHALSMYGDLKYGPGFKHFDYVNPSAPKGGDVKLAAIGTFDNLNPFILKGNAATAIGQIFDTLTV